MDFGVTHGFKEDRRGGNMMSIRRNVAAFLTALFRSTIVFERSLPVTCCEFNKHATTSRLSQESEGARIFGRSGNCQAQRARQLAPEGGRQNRAIKLAAFGRRAVSKASWNYTEYNTQPPPSQ